MPRKKTLPLTFGQSPTDDIDDHAQILTASHQGRVLRALCEDVSLEKAIEIVRGKRCGY